MKNSLGIYMAMAQMMGCDFTKMAESHAKGNVCEVCQGNGTIIGTGVLNGVECRCCSGKGHHEKACDFKI